MNIALIADDAKKTLMQNLCIAYKNVLSSHELYATGSTGRLIEEFSGLKVKKFLFGHLGGENQIGTMIKNNQIDCIIYLRDPARSEQSGASLFILCEEASIPIATNLASAEILIKALERGDMDWREWYK